MNAQDFETKRETNLQFLTSTLSITSDNFFHLGTFYSGVIYIQKFSENLKFEEEYLVDEKVSRKFPNVLNAIYTGNGIELLLSNQRRNKFRILQIENGNFTSFKDFEVPISLEKKELIVQTFQ
ncbi:hypothetical protein [Aureivirga marina]|uniref:hypothetical protein n=1 Tax=Aureivirga marina TaxID=1182451 RepID=UPI0018CA5C74|nr:hypothetical protein [Aureivirga marina]